MPFLGGILTITPTQSLLSPLPSSYVVLGNQTLVFSKAVLLKEHGLRKAVVLGARAELEFFLF